MQKRLKKPERFQDAITYNRYLSDFPGFENAKSKHHKQIQQANHDKNFLREGYFSGNINKFGTKQTLSKAE